MVVVFGLSDRAVADFSIDRCVETSGGGRLAQAGRFGCSAPHWGMTAVTYAARHPERVSHLGIIGSLAVGRINRDPPALV
jgi:pimeloyl-ACP methyl ester carboxylesterase